jgi:NAD(P)-dependent dehydrogenase (short-subunit alcohol dehydrogenase family)
VLDGKVAVVTGGGRGLGRVIAQSMCRSGAEVVVTGRDAGALSDTVDLIAADSGRASSIVTDLADPSSVDRLGHEVRARHGHVDVLVNNSGVAGPTTPLWELDVADWDATMDVNVRGVFLACRTFLPGMLERGRGSIVTIGSMTGKRPLTGRTPYAASKTALIGLTRTLAAEVGPRGVRVNLVSPGGIEGERIERVIAALADREGLPLDEARRRFTDDSPLRRLVPPDDVAAAVVFLASDAAASITGEDLNVSAGAVMY